MTLTPAYGRDYRSKKALLADWRAGRDFMAQTYTGQRGYINREGALREGLKTVSFRYGKLRKTTGPVKV